MSGGDRERHWGIAPRLVLKWIFSVDYVIVFPPDSLTDAFSALHSNPASGFSSYPPLIEVKCCFSQILKQHNCHSAQVCLSLCVRFLIQKPPVHPPSLEAVLIPVASLWPGKGFGAETGPGWFFRLPC